MICAFKLTPYRRQMLRGAKAPGHKIHMRGRQELLANVSKAGTSCTMIFTQHFFIIGQSEVSTSLRHCLLYRTPLTEMRSS